MEFAGASILVSFFSQKWAFHDCRFRGQDGPLASPMFPTWYPRSDQIMGLAGIFASVHESKGLIGKAFRKWRRISEQMQSPLFPEEHAANEHATKQTRTRRHCSGNGSPGRNRTCIVSLGN
jgi:hypothetical protein